MESTEDIPQAITVSPRGGTTPRASAGIRLPVEVMAQLDAICERDPLRPTRSRLIELAIMEFLHRRSAT